MAEPATSPMSTCRRSMKRIAYFILSASVAHLVFLNLSEGPAGRVGVDVLALTAAALGLAVAAGLYVNAKVWQAARATAQDRFVAAATHWLLVGMLVVVAGMVGFVF